MRKSIQDLLPLDDRSEQKAPRMVDMRTYGKPHYPPIWSGERPPKEPYAETTSRRNILSIEK